MKLQFFVEKFGNVRKLIDIQWIRKVNTSFNVDISLLSIFYQHKYLCGFNNVRNDYTILIIV